MPSRRVSRGQGWNIFEQSFGPPDNASKLAGGVPAAKWIADWYRGYGNSLEQRMGSPETYQRLRQVYGTGADLYWTEWWNAQQEDDTMTRRVIGETVKVSVKNWGNQEVDVAKIADAIEKNESLRTYLTNEGLIGEKIVEKRVEVEKKVTSKDVLTKDEVALIGEVLKIHEHRIHDETRRDYIETRGANWREHHQQAQTALALREKIGLPEHVFTTDCCVPSVEEADLAALAVTKHGIDVSKS